MGFLTSSKGGGDLFKQNYKKKMQFYSLHIATDTKILTHRESLLSWGENTIFPQSWLTENHSCVPTSH